MTCVYAHARAQTHTCAHINGRGQVQRGRVRAGHVYAPYYGYLFQIDYNCVLQPFGLYHANVMDVCTRTELCSPCHTAGMHHAHVSNTTKVCARHLVPRFFSQDRLTSSAWVRCHRIAALALAPPLNPPLPPGLSDIWANDKGGRLLIT